MDSLIGWIILAGVGWAIAGTFILWNMTDVVEQYRAWRFERRLQREFDRHWKVQGVRR